MAPDALPAALAAQVFDDAINDVSANQADLSDEVSTLKQLIEELTDQIAVLQRRQQDHKHPYRTGLGKGHNGISATTGPEVLP